MSVLGYVTEPEVWDEPEPVGLVPVEVVYRWVGDLPVPEAVVWEVPR